MSSGDTYLGYGSLISPSVVAAYFFGDRAEKVEEKYSGKNFSDDESVLVDEFVEKWKKIKGDVEMIPVKVQGLERSYSFKSGRGGLMLSASENPERWINTVVIRGLPGEQSRILDDVESDYQKQEIDLDRIEVYEQCEAEIKEKPVLYLSDSGEKFSAGDREINELYHRTIMQGIELLAEEYGEEFAEEFSRDFLETTFYEGEPVADHRF